ncbi:DUF6473 family protein [Demequina sp. NBRC 110051]|uniref:DUF6473 family protein n=1 Tax=Demequina sp. NBRC 110051 TaxID=1570340 RepID=UPI0009FFEFD8|nr:DUF6473 family protein [Demequina sp. NBRC 110051]
MADHLSGYQARDWDVVDYEMYQHGGSQLWFRGPRPRALERGRYVVCLGAAQTFGCFVAQPYPQLLEAELGMPVVNLGYGGAGPRFYVRHPELLPLINGAAAVVVQVMSARSEDNSRFASGGLELLTDRATGEQVSAAHAYAGLLAEHDDRLRRLPGPLRKAWRVLKGPHEVVKVLDETRTAWVDSYGELMSAITAPTVVLWFSKRRTWLHRTPRAAWWWQRYDDVNAMFGDYPQLVTPSMVRAVRPWADAYVRCVTDRGSPQPLVSRFTGERISVDYGRDRPDLAEVRTDNPYYPSPQMHEDVCAALVEPVRALVKRSTATTPERRSGARA